MVGESDQAIIREAGASDVGALATLRALWSTGDHADPGFERRLADWLAGEGDRRTTWLASVGELPVGMASMLEYRRMPHPTRPDSRWGYVSNMFVVEDFRRRGIGTALLHQLLDFARARHYARLVLSPSHQATASYRRTGFMPPGQDDLGSTARPPSRDVSARAAGRDDRATFPHCWIVAGPATRSWLPLRAPADREQQSARRRAGRLHDRMCVDAAVSLAGV